MTIEVSRSTSRRLRNIVLGCLVVMLLGVGLLLAVAATRPDTFRLERSIAISAAPERIFPLINDFRQWRTWSPYEGLDPDLARAYTGAPQGVAAVYEWEGEKAGAGRMEIIESLPARRILIDLRFTAPFEASNVAEFTLTPAGGQTRVTWSMRGPQPLLAKFMGMIFDIDEMVGKDFERGLAGLKAVVER